MHDKKLIFNTSAMNTINDMIHGNILLCIVFIMLMI